MYISRRINRIFVVPAVLAMVPSYPIGEIVYKEMFRTAVIVFFGLRGLLKLAILTSSRFKSNQSKPSEYPSWPS
jgi:hypothetical protein